MSSKDISEAMAYEVLEPFEQYRGDLRAGIVASTIANVNSARGKSFTPSDFMPKFNRTKSRKSKSALATKIMEVFGVGNFSKSSD